MGRAFKLAFTMFCLCASLYSIAQWLGTNVTPESETVQRVKLFKQLTNGTAGTENANIQEAIDGLSDAQVQQALDGDAEQLFKQFNQDERFKQLLEQLEQAKNEE